MRVVRGAEFASDTDQTTCAWRAWSLPETGDGARPRYDRDRESPRVYFGIRLVLADERALNYRVERALLNMQEFTRAVGISDLYYRLGDAPVDYSHNVNGDYLFLLTVMDKFVNIPVDCYVWMPAAPLEEVRRRNSGARITVNRGSWDWRLAVLETRRAFGLDRRGP
jgi:hypothetical protein